MPGMTRESPAVPPPLPPALAERLQGYEWIRNLVGEAGAGVYRLHRSGAPDLYLKHGVGAIARAVTDEMVRLRWLSGALAVPRVEHFVATGDAAWLLMRAMPGCTAWEWLDAHPDRGIELVHDLAATLRRLHALPAEHCPFNSAHPLRLAEAHRRLHTGEIDAEDFDDCRTGWTPEQVWDAMAALLPLTTEPVVTHGDFSLDNILVEDGRVTGLIDVGRAGIADRYQDLALLWNCLGEFGTDLQAELFRCYGIAAPDRARLEFHLLLDECF
ncbi:APH(3') family aminoglycoside O-phosphotransferase [Sphingomonas sp. MMS12-HWE2-04]|uniref:APH(3') family aminoglycoside O-phosphotransferase n=1 Tax=Sphingomonas sp. MMS12-HWE2-04 TaxID=3234199 RepID=UPI00384DE1A8